MGCGTPQTIGASLLSSLRDLIDQLRRRHVFRVAAAYAVVGWLVIEVSSTVAPLLLLPEWIPRAIIVLVILGFPVALVLAWAYDITPDGIRPSDPPPSPPEAREDAPAPEVALQKEDARYSAKAYPSRPAWTGRRRLGVVTLGVIGMAAVAGSFVVLRGTGAERLPTGDELLARLSALADAGRFVEAFDLAQAAVEEDESVPAALRARVTHHLTVTSDPSGARVRAWRFVPEEREGGAPAQWRDLGVTPIRGLEMARGDYLLRVEREGDVPVERLASTEAQRTSVPLEQVPEASIRVELLPEEAVHEGMVFVPGGPYSVASRNLQGLLANLGDFFLDRYEVTNADFAGFVAAGGYAAPEHWSALFTDDRVQEPATVLEGFVDRTDLPGPRNWSGQTPPAGEEDHPVTGITWYEAAAYCSFQNRRLPSFFEWEKAARNGEISTHVGIQLPWGPLAPGQGNRLRANFSGVGTTPVDAHPFGISPYGAYDMAGNVKEWVSNPTETGRAVTGGSWEDPVYLFPEVGSLNPFSTSSSLGFRCARLATDDQAEARPQDNEPLQVAVETPEYQPVGDETFAGLLSHYTYDPRPAAGEVVERDESSGWTRERILFDGPDEEQVIGYLYTPTASRPPYQTVAFVPGSDTFFGVSVPDATEWLLAPIIRSGRAVFAVVMEGMTERPFPPGTQSPEPHTARFRDQMVRHATELRMGLDYLETRDDIDTGALAYVGLSWGAGSRLTFAAVDDRYQAVIFIGGGIDERVHPTLPEASNINFAPRIQAPTLLLNGREDEEHPWLTRALPLWNLLSEPKELVLVEGAGHVPPPHERVPVMLDFLDRTVGPVRR